MKRKLIDVLHWRGDLPLLLLYEDEKGYPFLSYIHKFEYTDDGRKFCIELWLEVKKHHLRALAYGRTTPHKLICKENNKGNFFMWRIILTDTNKYMEAYESNRYRLWELRLEDLDFATFTVTDDEAVCNRLKTYS